MSSLANFDILVLGATGFTGRLITRYLATHPARSSFSIALGARSKAKLNALLTESGIDNSVGLIQVDVTKFDEIEDTVRRVKVVINTVGPFWNWGTPVVKACVRHGVHYVDLTGETPWIRDIIDQFDYFATKTGSIIIPSCGMDSVPSELSVFLANKALKELGGPDAEMGESTTAFKMRGGISGGTLASAIAAFESVPREKLRAASMSYALSAIRGPRLPRPRLFYRLPHRLPPQIGGYFFMSGPNKAIVQRTWGLNELAKRHAASTSLPETLRAAKVAAYGPHLVYDEFLATRSRFQALALSVGFGIAAFCIAFLSPVRWLIKNYAPQPGEGPSDEAMKSGYLSTINVTSSAPQANRPQIYVQSTIVGRGDPGYLLSAVMVSEAALSILLDFDRLPAVGREGGILTPASALGDIFVERLRASGKFDLESGPLKEGEARKTR